MPASVVVYDPDGMLPSTFAYATGLGDATVQVVRGPDAHRLAEHARVIVLVAGRDNAAGLGFLASLGELKERLLVLLATDARRHRRVVIRAIRRGATVLIDQPPDALAAHVRGLVMPRAADPSADHLPSVPASSRGSWMNRAAASCVTGMQKCGDALLACVTAPMSAERLVAWVAPGYPSPCACPFRDDVPRSRR